MIYCTKSILEHYHIKIFIYKKKTIYSYIQISFDNNNTYAMIIIILLYEINMSDVRKKITETPTSWSSRYKN